jgi:NAD(P)-dependent dehydrogenase (short-subunit alcohol dehydrogenase family)
VQPSSCRVLDCQPSLRGKIAFVTGGLGGIGSACVQSLLAHGARVAFTYADGQELESAALEVVTQNPEYLSAHALDLRYNTSIQTCFRGVLERWGRVDILVNNAAVGSATVSAYADDRASQDSAMFGINADGTLKMCQAFLESMQHRATDHALKIINIASVGGGIQTFPGFQISDGMSKAAVAFMTRQLAAELTDSMIDVFAICPGATNTGMFQVSTLNPMTLKQRETFIRSMPKGRLIEPEEIANIVVFLASGYSTPLHGAVIDASMGLGVRPGLITEQTR